MKEDKPLFFVVSGTHGVGKTTVLEAAKSMLIRQGVPVRQFHHITDVMPAKSANPKVMQGPKPRRSWYRRLVPVFVKQIVSSFRDEMTYMHGINRILAEASSEGQIALSDRYAYDRLVDLRLHRRPLIQRAAVRIVCRLMRRPTLTFLLTDDPQAIRKRKKELTESQIAWYQNELLGLTESFGGRIFLLSVDGRDAQGVAGELVAILLEKVAEINQQVEQ